jgi:hypothetical protein
MICMLLHVTRFVCDDQKLVQGSFWTLGECAQVPFSCILVPGGFWFSNTLDLVMSSSYLDLGIVFSKLKFIKYEHKRNHFNKSKHQMFPLLQTMVHCKCFLMIIKFNIAYELTCQLHPLFPPCKVRTFCIVSYVTSKMQLKFLAT